MTDSKPNTNQPPATVFDRPTHFSQTKSVYDLVADLRKAQTWLLIAAFAAFLASAFFVVKYFAGGDMRPLQWSGEQWANAMLGLGITAVITAAQAFLYASGYKGQAATVATCIVVFFGIFSEVSQSMEREDATVRHRSESSPVFQAALGSINTLSAAAVQVSPEQQALADARGKLQYWQQLKADKQANAAAVKYSSNSIERNIARYQKTVATLEQQSGLHSANRAAVLTGAIAQAKALEYDEDKHYAMIRLLRDLLGVEGIWASFVFSLIIICTFEYAFHFVGAYVADHKKALLLLGRDTRGDWINPSAQAVSLNDTAIARDYGNELRDKYLNWVTPERSGTVATPEPTPTTTETRSEPPENNVHDLTRERLFKLLYTEIRARVIRGELRPTVRPVTDAVTEVIRHHCKALGLQPALIGKPERQKLAETMLEKLAQEHVLTLNSEQGIGKAKYVLASRWVQHLTPEIPNAEHVIR